MEKIIAAGERNQRTADREFEDAVEAVRLGTYFLHKPDAWSRWRQSLRLRAITPAATTKGLEQQVLHLALRAPRLVALPGQEPRRMKAADMAVRAVKRERVKRIPGNRAALPSAGTPAVLPPSSDDGRPKAGR